MANTFLVAKGKEIGSSIIEKSMVKTAKEYLENFSEKIILPTDCVLTTKTKEISVKAIDMIDKDEKILDIGPQSRMLFYNEILECENLLWNGPLGFFEEKPFNEGTNFVLKAIKNNKNKNFFSVAGGGDTISVLKQANALDYFSFISTGGGAFLEFIQGKGLPGLNSLNG